MPAPTITFFRCVLHRKTGEEMHIKDVDSIHTDSPLVMFGRGGRIFTVASLEPGEYVTTEVDVFVEATNNMKMPAFGIARDKD